MRFGKNVIVGVLSFFLAPAVYSFELGSFEVTPVATVKERFDDNITSAHYCRLILRAFVKQRPKH